MTTPISSNLLAGQAYGSSLQRPASESIAGYNGAKIGDSAVNNVGGSEFADLIGQSLEQVQSVGDRADMATKNHLNGDTSIVEVVSAISEAELTVQTLKSVRDRMISAYQEIARMPI